jgi:hypothetical protein
MVLPLLKTSYVFYGNVSFVVLFTRAHWHADTLFISLRFILISTSHRLCGIQRCIATLKSNLTIFVHNSFPPLPATRPAHITPIDCIKLIVSGEEQALWSSSLCCFLQSFLVATSPSVLEPALYILFQDERPSLKPVQKNGWNDTCAYGTIEDKEEARVDCIWIWTTRLFIWNQLHQ